MFTTPFDTNLGPCAISWDETGITGFHLLTPTPVEMGALPGKPNEGVRAIISRVQAHLEGVLRHFSDEEYGFGRVSEFHQAVYRQTLAIKVGSTCSYGDNCPPTRTTSRDQSRRGCRLGRQSLAPADPVPSGGWRVTAR